MKKLIRLLLPLLALTLVIALASSTVLGENSANSVDYANTAVTQASNTCDPDYYPPPLPGRFRGMITFLCSEPAPPGTVVTFKIACQTYVTTTPAEKDYGPSWYWIQIAPPAGSSYAGQPVYISVNGYPVTVATWEPGGNQEIHLSVPVAASQGTPGIPCATPAPSTPSSSDMPPALPGRYRGLVTVNGQPAPDGTTVTIKVGCETYQTTTPSMYGPSTYFKQVVPPLGKSFSGATVYFAVNGVPAKAVIWEPGGNMQLDLQT